MNNDSEGKENLRFKRILQKLSEITGVPGPEYLQRGTILKVLPDNYEEIKKKKINLWHF